jgi:hypothetical protein
MLESSKKRNSRNVSSDLWEKWSRPTLTDLGIICISGQMPLCMDPFTVNNELRLWHIHFKIGFHSFGSFEYFILSFFYIFQKSLKNDSLLEESRLQTRNLSSSSLVFLFFVWVDFSPPSGSLLRVRQWTLRFVLFRASLGFSKILHKMTNGMVIWRILLWNTFFFFGLS